MHLRFFRKDDFRNTTPTAIWFPPFIPESDETAPTHVRYDTDDIRAGAVLQNSNDINLITRNSQN